MKIIKFTKQKNGMYLLTLEDNTKYQIHEDLILKYDLLLTKKVNDKLLSELEKENKIYEIYEISLKYLNRPRSRKELYLYLLNKDYNDTDIIKVIEKLEKQDYLNESNYTKSFINDKILTTSYGPNKIISELRKNDISEDIITKEISIYNEELEKERIKKIIDKRINSNHNKSSLILKQNIKTYLLNLGYSNCYIDALLKNIKLDTEDIAKKEYEKLYNKLSKKYSGHELEYKLKQKMYQKGFIDYNEY